MSSKAFILSYKLIDNDRNNKRSKRTFFSRLVRSNWRLSFFLFNIFFYEFIELELESYKTRLDFYEYENETITNYAAQINWIEKLIHTLFAYSQGTSVDRVLPKIAFFLSR